MFRIAMPQTIRMSREHGLPICSECLSLSLSVLGAPSCTGFVFFLLRVSPFVFFLLLFQCVVFRGRSSSVKPIISSQCRRFSSSLWLPMLLQLSSSRGLTPPHWVSGAWTTAVMYGAHVQSSLQCRHSSPGHTMSMVSVCVYIRMYVFLIFSTTCCLEICCCMHNAISLCVCLCVRACV